MLTWGNTMTIRRRRALAAATALALPAVALSAMPAQADETPDAYQALWHVAWNDYDLHDASNAREATLGTDPLHPDTDGDGLADGDELRGVGTLRTTDGSGVTIPGRYVPTDPTRADTDADGLTDAQENQFCTDPSLTDTDGGTLPDAREVLELKNPTGDNLVNPLAADTDRDGVNDAAELAAGTKPNISNIPVSSYEEARQLYQDEDADGRSNNEERYSVYTNYSQDLDTDIDDDGVPDGVEANGCGTAEWSATPEQPHTRAAKADSDGDGLTDAQEISRGTNANAVDSYGDGFTDAQEGFFIAPDVDWFDRPLVIHVDPLDPGQNRNGVLDGQEFSLDGLTRA
ncbi:hypothetical protein [Kocuria palustris]|uniref:hypothetical protein n=1 Tax=Kocuria palustris TaxID=71999 RepID=UPI0021A34247|nr:hypothetical protein [Kocuria palustris]MCT1590780.1 hypothetical protein [Kocuria palustris]